MLIFENATAGRNTGCRSVLSSIPTHNNPVGFSLETWLVNAGDRNVRSIDEEGLHRVGNTYDFVYPKAHPPKVGAIPTVEI